MPHSKGWANGGTFEDEREGARVTEDLRKSEAWRVATKGSRGAV